MKNNRLALILTLVGTTAASSISCQTSPANQAPLAQEQNEMAMLDTIRTQIESTVKSLAEVANPHAAPFFNGFLHGFTALPASIATSYLPALPEKSILRYMFTSDKPAAQPTAYNVGYMSGTALLLWIVTYPFRRIYSAVSGLRAPRAVPAPAHAAPEATLFTGNR